MTTPDLTDNRSRVESLLDQTRVMAILRGFGVDETVRIAGVAWDLGLTCVEVPIQSEEDVEALAATVAAGRERGMAVGAGTVVDQRTIDQAVEAGAVFAVSPGFDPEVVRGCLDADLAPLPGVGTASEVQQATKLGLTWLKAFPASVLGTGWFKAMKGPFPQAKFISTGGMDARNAEEYLAAGARVIAVGSALNDPAQLPLLGDLCR